MATVAGIPSARTIAARAALERAEFRARSRTASRADTGSLDATAPSSRKINGHSSRTPATIAVVPRTISATEPQYTARSSAGSPAAPSATAPATATTAATAAERWTARGGAGRPDSACTIDRREATREGHHAAAAAATTASVMPVATTHHGTLNRSMR